MPSFVNPYTFIPLRRYTPPQSGGDDDIGNAVVEDEELLTGVIKCTLETRSKTIVPGEHASPEEMPFFKVERDGVEVPVIPGSSIRGMVRNSFEMMTDSCVRHDKNHDQYLSSVSGAKRPGILFWKEGKYVLWSAERFKVWQEHEVAAYQTGDMIDFIWKEPRELRGNRYDKTKVANTFFHKYTDEGGVRRVQRHAFVSTDMGSQPDNDRLRGVFLRVYPLTNGTSHARPSVFVAQKVIDGDVAGDYVDRLGENISMYVENNKGTGDPYPGWYKDCFEAMRAGSQVLPVWFGCQEIGGKRHYQFSWAQLGRSVYNRRLSDMYGDMNLRACPTVVEGRTRICPACELFGYVNEDADSARAGRVRFGDAMPASQDWGQFGWVWLPVLSNPRSSSFEFYLRNGTSPRMFTPEFPGTVLAGRKLYWHHAASEDKADGRITSEGGELLNSRVQYVPAGVSFDFDVCVDGVTKLQLNHLLYALTYGEYLTDGANGTADGVCCQRIGRGKPYGYGSVHIRVKGEGGVAMRRVDGGSYNWDFDESTWKMTRQEAEQGLINLTAIKKVASTKQRGIAYPTAKDKDGVYQVYEWFSDNRVQYALDASIPLYKKVLPQVMEGQNITQDLPEDSEFQKRDGSKRNDAMCVAEGANAVAKEAPEYATSLSDAALASQGHEDYAAGGHGDRNNRHQHNQHQHDQGRPLTGGIGGANEAKLEEIRRRLGL